MKKVLLGMLLIALSGAAFSASGPGTVGHWDSWAQLTYCDQEPDQVCAEWIQAGSPLDGTLCCIRRQDMWSSSFSACLRALEVGPDRPPSNPL